MARNQIDKRSEYTVTLYPDELEAVGHDRRTAEEAHAYMMERGAKCLRCPLFGLRAGPVRSELRPDAPLLVCGDVPEQDDVDSKRPFVGRAGLMLEEAAWEGGVAREEASFANAISCRPPEEYAAYTARVRIEYEKRVKEAEEAGLPVPPEVLMPEEACHPRLMTDITEAKPLVALALGVSAVKAVAAAYDVPYGAKGRKARVGEAKISSLKRVLGSPVCPPGKPIIIATYHPAWTARQGNKHYGHIVHGHIAKAARIAARGGRLDWKDADITTLDPTIEQVRETFARFAAHVAPVYCDIETDSAMARTATLRCIGYGQLRADGLWEVIVVPFRRIDGTAFWSPEDEAVLRAECLAFHKQVRLVGHNFVMFDSEKLLREGLLDDWTQSFGDCYLDSATEFLTVRGWLKYDEIGAADKLATIDAAGAIEFQPYFDRVARQYTGSVYEVMTQYSRAIVTPTHRMLVSAVGRRPDAGWRFVPLKTLLDAKHSSFNIRTAPAGVSVSVRRDSADGVDLTPDFLTFLGLVISDGCIVTADGVIRGVTVSQKLGGKAEAELLRLQSVLGLKRTEHVHYESWRSAPIIEVHWSIFSTQLANRIHAWTGQYAATKHLPPWYMELDTAQRLALMRGLMLGDGSHDRKAHKYRTFSHRLRDDVQVLALSLGIPASHHIDGECYAVSMRPDKGQTALVRMRADVRTSNGRIRTRQVRDARIVCFSVPNESLVTRAGGRVAFHGNTMLKHRNTIANDAPHSLGFCISQYTEAPAHKDDANDKYLDGGADDVALHGYCLNALTRIKLADGTTDTIRRLLERQGPVDVLSLNLQTRKIEPRRVTRFYRVDAPGQAWVEVKHARQLTHHTGAITTPDHEWYTERGWIRADKLTPGDRVCTAELQFSADQMAAVLGTVLGDSTLAHSPALRCRPELAPGAYLQFGHAAHSGLTQEKIRCLSDVLEFSQQLIPARRVHVTGREGQGTPVHHASSRNRLQLQDVYLRIYRNGVRTVSEGVLDALGPVGLAWWFMDDGCKQKGGRTKNTGVRGGRLYASDSVVIATQSFSRDEVDLIVRWFCRRYGPASAGKDRVLRLSRSASVAFTEDVAPYVFPAQRYKFPRDLTLPPFVDIARSDGSPLMVDVGHVGPTTPIEGPNVRYCLDVEGNHNFFTTSGLVHNCAKDVHRTGIVDISLRAENAACGTEQAYKTDLATAPVYRNMGDLGMVIDIAKHREMWIKFETQRRALIKRAQDVVGDDKFNPNAPDQVRDFLYRKKGLIPVISTQKGKEWRPGDDPSTNANALQQLILKRALDEQTTQFIDALSKYRAVSKVVGSYIEGLVKDRTPKADLSDEDEEDIKGAPDPAKDLEAYIDWRYARISEVTNTTVTRELYPDLGELFMLHPQYKMHGPTGRVSTTPTIQNWPVIGVANMRELGIVPRGYKFVGADFEQIELRLYAVIADDQVVLEAFHNGLDVHTLNYATLRARNPSDMDEVMRIYHETVALKKRGDEGDKKAKDAVKAWRTLAKRFVYLICYGGETERLFATMSTDRDKATGELLFKGLTPQQVSIMYNNWHTVHPWTIQWQEREVAHAKQHGWIQAILDGRKRHFPGGLNKRNAAPNAKIQGSAAAITNRAVEILGGLIRHREWGIMSGLNLQIHDYIGAYVPAARADEAARMIQESMETTYMGMPFPAVPVISESWATQ